jgi:hypothetical protein
MTDPEPDETFEAFLKRRSVIPHPPDEGPEPPAELDRVVLRKAREAIGGRESSGAVAPASPRAPRWAVPVAVAATVLLCLSVVLNISLNTKRSDGVNEARRLERNMSGVAAPEVILPESKIVGASAIRPPIVVQRKEEAPRGAGDASPGSAGSADAAQSALAAAAPTAPAAPAREEVPVADATPPHPADPESWLRQIETLRAAGKKDLAEVEMRRFRALFPDYAAKAAPPVSSESPK